MKLLPKKFFEKVSLTFRLSLGITLLIMFLIAATSFTTYLRDRDLLYEETYSRGWSIIETVQSLAVTSLQSGNYQSLQDFTTKLAGDSFVQKAVITDKSGKIIAHSNPENTGQPLQAINLEQVKEKYSKEVPGNNGNTTALQFAAPITAGGSTEGYVYLAADLSRLQAHMQETLKNIIINFVLASIAGLLLTRFIIIRNVYRPVKKLVEANEKIATGDFSQKVEIKSRDEMGYLGNSFNTMTEQLALLFQSVRNTVFDIGHISNQIMKRTEQLKQLKSEDAGDSSEQSEELAKEINSAARRLSRISNKLNSLALQYKTESTQPGKFY